MTGDPFERHNIGHLSPSSLRLFRDELPAWVAKYLLKAEDEGGPGAWRGKAVEAGVDRLLFGYNDVDADRAMRATWDLAAQGELSAEIEKEQGALPDFLVQAKIAFAGLPVPVNRQCRIELKLPGISVPFIGYCDWVWRDKGDDLKTTHRIPSKPDPQHTEQVAAYSVYTGLPFSLTYVSPKRWTRYEIIRPVADEAYDRLIEGALAIRSFLDHVRDGHDAMSMFSPDLTRFYYKPAMAEAVRNAKAISVLPSRSSPCNSTSAS